MAPPSLYRTTGSAIGEGSRVKTKADLVPPSVVVRRTDDLKKPVRPHVEDTDFIMTNTIKKETESIMAERVPICLATTAVIVILRDESSCLMIIILSGSFCARAAEAVSGGSGPDDLPAITGGEPPLLHDELDVRHRETAAPPGRGRLFSQVQQVFQILHRQQAADVRPQLQQGRGSLRQRGIVT
mmetsp:Transcript_1304/g.2924  ORF Transcript_1304/g.2924 Transcript_1304/m.2924 type:complete len:185 (-) Transcript_1304:465-1019(-)